MTPPLQAPAAFPAPAQREPKPNRSPRLLHELFEHAVRLHPGNVAIETPPANGRPRRTVTYAELAAWSGALACRLEDHVHQECIVAILLPRDSEFVYLAQLAALQAGAAYCCIDPSFPDEQVRNILQDARPAALLGDARSVARVRSLAPRLPCLDVTVTLECPAETPTRPDWLHAGSLAYVIFTSGTTGRPKGVMIEHGAIVNLIRGDLATNPVSPEDRVGQNSSCAYDSSLEEIWMALAAGATLVVMDDETTRLGPDLVPWLRDERITIFSPPPTLLRTTGCERPDLDLPDLRRIHVGGEPLPADVAQRWAPGRCLINDYGPTECSVVALRGRIGPGDPITIGRPVPGIRAWILDENLEEVAPGQQGELCLGGAGLARGYLNDPEMTARKFPSHPRLGRLYRTGDLAHVDLNGLFHCHGRIDTQVKIRGYRIELEAIEARLVEQSGVREAACRVQGDGPARQIVAFLVLDDSAGRDVSALLEATKAALRRQLPEYMVPAHLATLERLPTTVSGKLDRRALPVLQVLAPSRKSFVAPRGPIEEKLAQAIRQILDQKEPVSADHDFFLDLGGDSLRAARLISLLRDDPETAGLTVRNVYEAPTVAGLASRVRPARNFPSTPRPAARRVHPALATLVQTAWLGLGLVLGGFGTYLLAFQTLPGLASGLGVVPALLLSPLFVLAGVALYALLSVTLAVAIKRLLIGRYRSLRAPVWGQFFVRHWMVVQTARLIPWRLLEGTVFQVSVLRALGARIGKRVHIHRGVDLAHGGWDLLEIGDDVSIGQDASLRLIDYEDGQVVVAPVTLGRGSTLEVRAGVAGGAEMEPGAYLTALSVLSPGQRIPAGQRWDGIPAARAGEPPSVPLVTPELSPLVHGLAVLLARAGLTLFFSVPLVILSLVFALAVGLDEVGAEISLTGHLSAGALCLGALLTLLSVPLTLVFQCLALRLLGRVREGTISRWSLGYVRVWLKAGILASANDWLSGSLLWRVWLRAAGMQIGRNSEVGTILDTIPELVEIGPNTFFADGVYLGGPLVHRGTVVLGRVRLGENTFLGNHAVIPGGTHLPGDVLLGVCTVADPNQVRPGTSWFGHPPFELPRREVVEFDRRYTHEPSRGRYINRVFWELLRFTLPLGPAFLAIIWLELLGRATATFSLPVVGLAIVPALDLGFLAALCLLVLAMKWVLLGRVRPGLHPLWSCWCSRWDFHYVAWEHLAHGPLSALEGTIWLTWYLRAMGVRIGHSVVLGPGFAHVVDPDMLQFDDGATVSCYFQAHTFEDRVLKIDHVRIRAGASVGPAAVLLYGADVGERTLVLAHSVVMKRERLLPDRTYSGCPTVAV